MTQQWFRKFYNQINLYFQMIFVILFAVFTNSIIGQRVDWEDDPDLVEEEEFIQGREKVRLMIAMLGERKKLSCQIAFAQEPLGQIVWRLDGQVINPTSSMNETFSGEIFIEQTYEFDVTKELADREY